jgi:SAM-dependent methyltransferase
MPTRERIVWPDAQLRTGFRGRIVIRDVLNSPWVYVLWQSPFVHQKFEPVRRHGLPASGSRVLDVGCGPGTNARYFGGSDYVGVDLDGRYIDYAEQQYDGRFLVRDVNEGLRDLGKFDFVLLNSLMHHLDEGESDRLLDSLTDTLVVGGVLHVLDLVLPPTRSAARTLARLDRGAYPREYDLWLDLIGRRFVIESHQPYSVCIAGVSLWEMIHVVCRTR